MNLETRLEELKAEHQSLEEQIKTELDRPLPDELRIQEMKRQKLRIKDELFKLSSEPAH